MSHSSINHGVRCIDPVLVIFAQAPIITQPGKGAFRHPPLRDYLKTGHIRQAARNLHVNPDGLGLLDEGSRISTISPQLFETRETFPQTREQPDSDRAIVIVGFADKGFEHEAFGVHHQMTLAPFDFLAAIIASYAPFSVVLTD